MAPKDSWKPYWSEKTATWVVDFRVDGRRIRRRLPVTDRGSRDIAYTLARDLYREAWHDALAPKPKNEQTFFGAANDYISSGGEARFLPKIIEYFGRETLVSSIGTAEIVKAATSLYPTFSK